MARHSIWRRDFRPPQAQRRWLGTLALAIIFFFREQASLTVAFATMMYVSFWWCYYVNTSLNQAPPPFSDFDEYMDFIHSRAEFKIWCSTTKAVFVALVTTFFPRGTMTLLAVFYIVGLLGWIAFFSPATHPELRPDTSFDASPEALKDLERLFTSISKKKK